MPASLSRPADRTGSTTGYEDRARHLRRVAHHRAAANGVRSCPPYPTSSTANTAMLALLKCGNSFFWSRLRATRVPPNSDVSHLGGSVNGASLWLSYRRQNRYADRRRKLESRRTAGENAPGFHLSGDRPCGHD